MRNTHFENMDTNQMTLNVFNRYEFNASQMLIGVVVWFPILKLFKTFLDLNKQISFFVAMKYFVFNRQNINTLRTKY